MNIQTFIFLDMETTGLPFEEGNRTKITELCLAAVLTEHIGLGVFPRVLNKLSLCFNPLKTIMPVCRDLTGLTNELLQNQSDFRKETVEVIKSFLALQKKPLCLVAHNGNIFDYPILQAEIYNAGAALPDDVLCIDSLQAFRELHGQSSTKELDIHDLATQVSVPMEFCDGLDELLFDIAEKVEISECQLNEIQQVNEKTPVKKTKLYITDYFVNKKANMSNMNGINRLYYMPNATENKGEKSQKQGLNLNLGKSNSAPSSFRRQSFKLAEVYSRLTNKEPIDSHKAEHDCAMLIECATKIGPKFINWANLNARKFSEVRRMQPGPKYSY